MAKAIVKTIKISIVLLFCASAMKAGAQNIVSICGRVVDSISDNPLPYCNVYLTNSNVGSTTGLDGYFKIKTSKSNLPDSLTIQFIGYKKRTVVIEKDGASIGEIALIPQTTELKTIVVSGKTLNWNKILNGVFDSCNFRTFPTPNVSTAYYKETFGYNNDNITEVAVNVLFPKKNKRHKTRDGLIFSNSRETDECYYVTGLRKTQSGKVILNPELTQNPYGIFDCNGLSNLLKNNIYFYKNGTFEKLSKKTLFRLEKTDTIDGNKVYTLKGNINKHDQTIELSICFNETKKIIYSYALKITKDYQDGQTTESYLYNFRITNNLALPLFFHYQSIDEDIVNDKTFHVTYDVLFSDTRQCDDAKPFGKEYNSKNSFEFQGITYDKNFWDKYTIIE